MPTLSSCIQIATKEQHHVSGYQTNIENDEKEIDPDRRPSLTWQANAAVWPKSKIK
jgi:hypothetical protein